MILHLDMDAFFASVEQLDHPEYRGKPLIVGGGGRGVVSTASYEARKFGVHSAMPMATARKLCPDGVFIKGNYARYSAVSRLIMDRLAKISPQIQPASIDEAYVQVPANINTENYAKLIKAEVFNASGGLTCSAGVAPVKFLAKICSDYRKPDGLFILEEEKMDAFLLGLDIRKIPGVGARMAASLAAYGIRNVEQLRALSRRFLEEKYGKFGIVLHERAFGVDRRQVHANPPPKSEGTERTFESNVSGRDALESCLAAQADKIAQRLQKQGLKGRTITLKIKFADFRQITRARSLVFQVDAAQEIYRIAKMILDETHLFQPVRLIGICVSGFERRPEQLFLPGLSPPLAKIKHHSGD